MNEAQRNECPSDDRIDVDRIVIDRNQIHISRNKPADATNSEPI